MKDTGIGIPEDKLGAPFVKFSQVDASITRRFGGTGLGLAIARQPAALMGGESGVESEEGAGSESWFTVRLRRLPSERCGSQLAPSTRVGARSSESLLPRFEGARVLVVEDNATNQRVAVGLLRKLGVHAKTAGNGWEAIEALRASPFDAVLMDVQMPEMDGLEACRLIRDRRTGARDPQVLVIAMTAHAMGGDRERCLEAGMIDYLTKPASLGRLAEVLARHLPPGGERRALRHRRAPA